MKIDNQQKIERRGLISDRLDDLKKVNVNLEDTANMLLSNLNTILKPDDYDCPNKDGTIEEYKCAPMVYELIKICDSLKETNDKLLEIISNIEL